MKRDYTTGKGTGLVTCPKCGRFASKHVFPSGLTEYWHKWRTVKQGILNIKVDDDICIVK